MLNPKRFILDTNVLISAFIVRATVTYSVLSHCVSKGMLLFSTDTFEEFYRVISRSKFDKYFSDSDRRKLVYKVLDISQYQKVSSDLKLCTGETDNMFLNLAVDGGASCIVTGDKALLQVNPLGNIPILNPRQFLCYFAEFGGPMQLNEPYTAYGST